MDYLWNDSDLDLLHFKLEWRQYYCCRCGLLWTPEGYPECQIKGWWKVLFLFVVFERQDEHVVVASFKSWRFVHCAEIFNHWPDTK